MDGGHLPLAHGAFPSHQPGQGRCTRRLFCEFPVGRGWAVPGFPWAPSRAPAAPPATSLHLNQEGFSADQSTHPGHTEATPGAGTADVLSACRERIKGASSWRGSPDH